MFCWNNTSQTKWVINFPCNPNKNNIKNHVETISGTLDIFLTKYENILLLGNFNACVDDETIKDLCSFCCLNNHHAFKPELHRQDYLIFTEWLFLFWKWIFQNYHHQLLATETFKVLKMKGLWISFIWL